MLKILKAAQLTVLVAAAVAGLAACADDGPPAAADDDGAVAAFCSDKAGVDDVVDLAAGGDANDLEHARREVAAFGRAAAGMTGSVLRSQGAQYAQELLAELDETFSGPGTAAADAGAAIDAECEQEAHPVG
jgi:hypothetical protein